MPNVLQSHKPLASRYTLPSIASVKQYKTVSGQIVCPDWWMLCFLFCRDSRLQASSSVHQRAGQTAAQTQPRHHAGSLQTPQEVRKTLSFIDLFFSPEKRLSRKSTMNTHHSLHMSVYRIQRFRAAETGDYLKCKSVFSITRLFCVQYVRKSWKMPL